MASLADLLTYSQNLAKKYTSLDTPKDQTLSETAGDIALGFVPGLGTAQSARDFERSRRDNDWLGMGLSAAGMIPIVGGIPSAIKKVTKVEQLANALKRGSEVEQAITTGLRTSGSPGRIGGLAEAQAAAQRAAGSVKPLANAPTGPITVAGQLYVPAPVEVAVNAAKDYMKKAGLEYKPPTSYKPVNEERASRIAQAFETMPHDPHHPEVKAAYNKMIDETLDQWDSIKKTGLKVNFITPDMPDPYAASPRQAIMDVRDNNHLWVFPTKSGFGGSESSHVDISGNPLLRKTGEVIDGIPVTANDIFRIVHDYFGHIKHGHGFRAAGEENAWRSHSSMYTPLARKAMTTETRGQNSWVNYGPFGQFNKTASGSKTQYAPQKIGLLPDWVVNEGIEN